MPYQSKKIGELDVIHVPGDHDGPAVVLFHGFGTNNLSLLELSKSVKAPVGTNWYFPNGIVDLAPAALMFGMNGFMGRS